MADNETKIRLTAVDEVTAKLNSIKGAAGELTSSFGKLQGAFAAIGVSAAVGGLVASISAAIKAAASMEELSQKTGIATKELSALDYAMRREGVSTEAFGKAMKELSKNMVEAGDASSKTGKIFKTLGVDAGGSTRDALLKVADTFQKLPDGATKAALAVQLFGKAGMDMIPALNNGAEGIARIEEEARRLGITFDQETGRAAKDFSDKMFALNERSKALGISLATNLIEPLNRVAGAAKLAAEEGGTLKAAWIALGGIAAELIGLNDTDVDKQKKRIKDLTDQILAAQTLVANGPKELGNGVVDRAEVNKAIEDIKRLKAELASAQTLADAVAGKFQDSSDRRRLQGKDLMAGKRLENQVQNDLRAGGTATADPGLNLLVQLQQEYAKLNNLTQENATLERVLFDLKKQGNEKIAPALKARIIDEAKLIDALKARLALEKFLAAENQKDIDAAAERGRALESLSNQWAEGTDALEQELKLIGLTNTAREKAILLEKARLDIVAAGGDAATIRNINANLGKQLALLDDIGVAQKNYNVAQSDLKSQAQVWADLSTAAGDFFADLVLNGKNAFDNLRASLKRWLAEMISAFARQWVLNIVASGGGTFSAAASAAGGASGYLNGVSTLASGASIIGTGIGQTGIAQFYGGVSGAIQGPGLTGAAGVGQALAPYLGAIGIAAAVVVGMLTADGQFSRGWRIDNNANAGGSNPFARLGTFASSMEDGFYRKLGFNDRWAAILSGSSVVSRIFGNRARQNDAMGISGDLGPGGVTGQNWQDWSRQGGWFSSTQRGTDFSPFSAEQADYFKKITDGIGSLLGTVGTLVGADPSRALAGYSKPFNFQLNENGQPLTDEQISKLFGDFFGQALQEQMTLVLQDGGKTELSDYVKALTGTGDEITAKVLELVDLMQVLKKVDILGLKPEDVIKWKKEGESLSDTFARIAQSWAQYQDLFLSDGEKIALAQKQLSAGFADLGIAMPVSNEAFRKLVEGLDLSTEEGRKLFDGLMKLAPGFAAVQSAAASLLASFDQIASKRNPGLARTILEGDLRTTVEAFMARNPWTQGMDWRAVAQQINLITSNDRTRSDFRNYSPEDQTLILRILGITDDLNGLGDAATNAAEALGGVGQGVAASINSWVEIKGNLWQFLRGLYTDRTLSPLAPDQQLDTLKSRFNLTLAQARNGNITAGQSLPDLIQQILTLGREQFGSTGRYLDLFNWITGAAGDFVQPGGGQELQRLAYEEQKAQTKLMAENNALMRALYDRMGTSAAYVADATLASGEQVAGAYSNAAAATVRR